MEELQPEPSRDEKCKSAHGTDEAANQRGLPSADIPPNVTKVNPSEKKLYNVDSKRKASDTPIVSPLSSRSTYHSRGTYKNFAELRRNLLTENYTLCSCEDREHSITNTQCNLSILIASQPAQPSLTFIYEEMHTSARELKLEALGIKADSTEEVYSDECGSETFTPFGSQVCLVPVPAEIAKKLDNCINIPIPCPRPISADLNFNSQMRKEPNLEKDTTLPETPLAQATMIPECMKQDQYIAKIQPASDFCNVQVFTMEPTASNANEKGIACAIGERLSRPNTGNKLDESSTTPAEPSHPQRTESTINSANPTLERDPRIRRRHSRAEIEPSLPEVGCVDPRTYRFAPRKPCDLGVFHYKSEEKHQPRSKSLSDRCRLSLDEPCSVPNSPILATEPPEVPAQTCTAPVTSSIPRALQPHKHDINDCRFCAGDDLPLTDKENQAPTNKNRGSTNILDGLKDSLPIIASLTDTSTATKSVQITSHGEGSSSQGAKNHLPSSGTSTSQPTQSQSRIACSSAVTHASYKAPAPKQHTLPSLSTLRPSTSSSREPPSSVGTSLNKSTPVAHKQRPPETIPQASTSGLSKSCQMSNLENRYKDDKERRDRPSHEAKKSKEHTSRGHSTDDKREKKDRSHKERREHPKAKTKESSKSLEKKPEKQLEVKEAKRSASDEKIDKPSKESEDQVCKKSNKDKEISPRMESITRKPTDSIAAGTSSTETRKPAVEPKKTKAVVENKRNVDETPPMVKTAQKLLSTLVGDILLPLQEQETISEVPDVLMKDQPTPSEETKTRRSKLKPCSVSFPKLDKELEAMAQKGPVLTRDLKVVGSIVRRRKSKEAEQSPETKKKLKLQISKQNTSWTSKLLGSPSPTIPASSTVVVMHNKVLSQPSTSRSADQESDSDDDFSRLSNRSKKRSVIPSDTSSGESDEEIVFKPQRKKPKIFDSSDEESTPDAASTSKAAGRAADGDQELSGDEFYDDDVMLVELVERTPATIQDIYHAVIPDTQFIQASSDLNATTGKGGCYFVGNYVKHRTEPIPKERNMEMVEHVNIQLPTPPVEEPEVLILESAATKKPVEVIDLEEDEEEEEPENLYPNTTGVLASGTKTRGPSTSASIAARAGETLLEKLEMDQTKSLSSETVPVATRKDGGVIKQAPAAPGPSQRTETVTGGAGRQKISSTVPLAVQANQRIQKPSCSNVVNGGPTPSAQGSNKQQTPLHQLPSMTAVGNQEKQPATNTQARKTNGDSTNQKKTVEEERKRREAEALKRKEAEARLREAREKHEKEQEAKKKQEEEAAAYNLQKTEEAKKAEEQERRLKEAEEKIRKDAELKKLKEDGARLRLAQEKEKNENKNTAKLMTQDVINEIVDQMCKETSQTQHHKQEKEKNENKNTAKLVTQDVINEIVDQTCKETSQTQQSSESEVQDRQGPQAATAPLPAPEIRQPALPQPSSAIQQQHRSGQQIERDTTSVIVQPPHNSPRTQQAANVEQQSHVSPSTQVATSTVAAASSAAANLAHQPRIAPINISRLLDPKRLPGPSNPQQAGPSHIPTPGPSNPQQSRQSDNQQPGPSSYQQPRPTHIPQPGPAHVPEPSNALQPVQQQMSTLVSSEENLATLVREVKVLMTLSVLNTTEKSNAKMNRTQRVTIDASIPNDQIFEVKQLLLQMGNFQPWLRDGIPVGGEEWEGMILIVLLVKHLFKNEPLHLKNFMDGIKCHLSPMLFQFLLSIKMTGKKTFQIPQVQIKEGRSITGGKGDLKTVLERLRLGEVKTVDVEGRPRLCLPEAKTYYNTVLLEAAVEEFMRKSKAGVFPNRPTEERHIVSSTTGAIANPSAERQVVPSTSRAIASSQPRLNIIVNSGHGGTVNTSSNEIVVDPRQSFLKIMGSSQMQSTFSSVHSELVPSRSGQEHSLVERQGGSVIIRQDMLQTVTIVQNQNVNLPPLPATSYPAIQRPPPPPYQVPQALPPPPTYPPLPPPEAPQPAPPPPPVQSASPSTWHQNAHHQQLPRPSQPNSYSQTHTPRTVNQQQWQRPNQNIQNLQQYGQSTSMSPSEQVDEEVKRLESQRRQLYAQQQQQRMHLQMQRQELEQHQQQHRATSQTQQNVQRAQSVYNQAAQHQPVYNHAAHHPAPQAMQVDNQVFQPAATSYPAAQRPPLPPYQVPQPVPPPPTYPPLQDNNELVDMETDDGSANQDIEMHDQRIEMMISEIQQPVPATLSNSCTLCKQNKIMLSPCRDSCHCGPNFCSLDCLNLYPRHAEMKRAKLREYLEQP